MTYTEYLDSKNLKVCYNKFDELSTDVSDENINDLAQNHFYKQEPESKVKYPVAMQDTKVRYPPSNAYDTKVRYPPVNVNDHKAKYPQVPPQNESKAKYPVATQEQKVAVPACMFDMKVKVLGEVVIDKINPRFHQGGNRNKRFAAAYELKAPEANEIAPPMFL